MTQESLSSLERFIGLLQTEGLSASGALERLRAENRPSESEVLRRLALVRTFDVGLYHQLVEDIDEAPAFADLVKLPEVDALSQAKGTYWLRGSAADNYLRDWNQREEELHQWHARLASFFSRERPSDVLNHIYHLLRANPEQGFDLFEKEFRISDERFDLARCLSLLGILNDPRVQLPEELAYRRRHRQRYYQARSLFADAYYRASTYYPRDSVHSAVERFFGSADHWILHLYATGGMGKSIFLRWLIARRLVPEGTACAKVDLDELPLELIRQQPWLLLIPIADQLNEQLGTFGKLLEQYKDQRMLLRAVSPGVSPPGPADLSSILGQSLQQQFISLLGSVHAERLVIVLDTLEGLTFHPGALAKVMRQLEEVQASVPALRLIIAGRYFIPERVPELSNLFTQSAELLSIERFSYREASEYLTQRGVVDPEVRDAIITKVREPLDEKDRHDGNLDAGSNPFKLSLMAELALSRTGITAPEVLSFPQVDLAYLLERVIKRIPEQPLRWAVRYGAIARQVTPGFIKAVLLNPLREALQGSPTGDEVKQHWPVGPDGYHEQDVWLPEPGREVTTAELWKDLQAYASERGWLTRVGDEAVKFHADVTVPMRDLLARQQIFCMLQRRARDHFERLAAEDPEHWDQWICEAVFHAFQVDGRAADSYWRKWLRTAPVSRDPSVRLTLAQEVLGPDYTLDECTPLRREDGDAPIVDEGTLLHAHTEAARALIDLIVNGRLAVAEAISDLTKHCMLAGELQPHPRTHNPTSSFLLAMISALSVSLGGSAVEALELTTKALKVASRRRDRLLLTMQQADLLATLDDSRAVPAYEKAIAQAPRQHAFGPRKRDLRRKLAAFLARKGDYRAARRHYETAIREAPQDGSRLELEHLLAEFLLQAGDPDSASPLVTALAELEHRIPGAGGAYLRLEAELAHACSTMELGLQRADLAVDRARSDEDIAHNRLTRGDLRAQVMQFSAALEDYEKVESVLVQQTQAASVEGLARVRLSAIRLHGRGMGNYAKALSMIRDAEELPGMRAPEFQVRLAIERLFALFHNPEAAADLRECWDELSRLSVLLAPMLRIKIVSAGLAARFIDAENLAADEFSDWLKAVQPPSARLRALSLLRYCPVLGLDPKRRRQLLRLVPPVDPKQPSFATACLQLAEIQRVLGDQDLAFETLQVLTQHHFPHNSEYLHLRVIQALSRLPSSDKRLTLLPSTETSSATAGGLTFLQAVKLVELIGIIPIEAEEYDITQTLPRAAEALSSDGIPNRWLVWLHLHWARLARLEGDRAQAESALIQARELCQRLGNGVRTQWVDQLLAGLYGEAPLSVPKRVSFELVLSPAGHGGRVPTEQQVSILEGITPLPGRRVNGALPNMLLTDWKTARENLADLLLTRRDRNVLRYPAMTPTVYLQVPFGPLAGVPWELIEFPGEAEHGPGHAPGIRYVARRQSGVFPRHTIRWVQASLNYLGLDNLPTDGVFTHQTKSAIERYQSSRGLPALGMIDDNLRATLRRDLEPEFGPSSAAILIVQPRETGQETAPLTYAMRGGFNLAQRYERTWRHVTVLTEPTPEQLRRRVLEVQPSVLYFIATMREEGGAIYLDFSRALQQEWDQTRTPFTTSKLDRMLSALPPTAPSPFVILDIAPSGGPWDTIVDLTLRNQFAAHLLQLDNCSGILATGLAQPRQLEPLAHGILEALTTGIVLGELAIQIRRLAADPWLTRSGRDELLGVLPFLATALFTNDADLPCIWMAPATSK
jgi:tetratricopeptide (TPR) repeat protein